MNIWKVPVDFRNISNIEKSVSVSISGDSYTISILPIPETNKCCTTIVKGREPILINKICVPFEAIIGDEVIVDGLSGDFMYGYISDSGIRDEFDTNRLGKDLFLFYVEEE